MLLGGLVTGGAEVGLGENTLLLLPMIRLAADPRIVAFHQMAAILLRTLLLHRRILLLGSIRRAKVMGEVT
jgi:hypothetical protein